MTMLTRRFPRRPEALADIFELVREFGRSTQLAPAVQFSTDFALEEIFTNMLKYNAGGQSDVEISLEVRDRQLVISLTDFDTKRFDINVDAPAVDAGAPLSERTPGGLGVHLVKKMMDRVEYIHHDRTGTITLYKNLE